MNLAADLNDPILKRIGTIADKNGREVYIVGGYVRDIFLNRSSVDIDFVTVGSGIGLAREIASELGDCNLSIFATYGTAQVKYHGLELEFVGARRESYSHESRNPVVEDGTLHDDLSRRDFTVNAMAVSLNEYTFGELIDPFNGIIDLHNKILRTPLDPDTTFSDDPLRMMRAIRFATQLSFNIISDTFDAIKRNADRIRIITKERINDELSKIIRSPKPSIGFKLLEMSGILDIIMPEVCTLKGVESKEGRGHKDNFLHTLQVVDNVARKSENEWLRWAALLHDIAKPVTKRFDPKLGWTFHNHNFIGERMVPRLFRKMKMPLNDKMKYVAKLVGLHMRPQSVGEEGVSDSGVRRLITDAGKDLEDLMILCEADITSKNPAKVRRILNGFATLRKRMDEISQLDEWRNWKNPVNGFEIMQTFGIPGSPVIAEMKGMIKEAILDGKIENNHTAAWEYLLKIAAKKGLYPVNQDK